MFAVVLGAVLQKDLPAQVTTSLWLADVAAGPANWSTVGFWNTFPTNGNNVVINNGAVYPAAVTLDVDATVGQFTIGPGASLTLANGRKLTFTGNSSLDGTLSLNAISTNTELIVDGLLTVSGAGSITMSNAAQNRIRGASASDTLTNQTTIQGSGALGANALGIVNQGVIVANGSVPLVIDPSAGGLINTSILRATGGGTLQLKSGTFTNTGGTIEAQNASVVQIESSDVIGGSFVTSGSGRIEVIGPTTTFQDVTLALGSLLNLTDGVSVTLINSFVNNGTLGLVATGADTDLKMSGTVTLTGTGTITLTDSDKNRISADGTGTLVLDTNQVLQGAGKLGRNNLVITNLGTITALGTNMLEIDNDGSTFTNQGTLKAVGSGGIRVIDSTVSNQGTVEITSAMTTNGSFAQSGSSSSTRLLGGTLSASSLTFAGGSLTGSGTITGPTSATGTTSILPGGAGIAGTLTFNQTFTLGSSNTVFFDLGGTAPGTGYDRIVGTTINVAGNLNVAFTNSFQFSVGSSDTFTLISASTALNGSFSSLVNGSRFNTTDGFGSFQINYLANSITLSNFQAVPEPSTWALLALGAVSCGGFHLARRYKRSPS